MRNIPANRPARRSKHLDKNWQRRNIRPLWSTCWMKSHGSSICVVRISTIIPVCHPITSICISLSSLLPVFFAYAVVTINYVELFVNKAQLDEAAFNYVKQVANIQSYETFFEYLKQLPPHLKFDAGAVRTISLLIYDGSLTTPAIASAHRR